MKASIIIVEELFVNTKIEMILKNTAIFGVFASRNRPFFAVLKRLLIMYFSLSVMYCGVNVDELFV